MQKVDRRDLLTAGGIAGIMYLRSLTTPMLPEVNAATTTAKSVNATVANRVAVAAAKVAHSSKTTSVRLGQLGMLTGMLADDLSEQGTFKLLDTKVNDLDFAAPLDPTAASSIILGLKKLGITTTSAELWPENIEARQATIAAIKKHGSLWMLRHIEQGIETPHETAPLAMFKQTAYQLMTCSPPSTDFNQAGWCQDECQQLWYLKGMVVLMGLFCTAAQFWACASAIALAASATALQQIMQCEGCQPC